MLSFSENFRGLIKLVKNSLSAITFTGNIFLITPTYFLVDRFNFPGAGKTSVGGNNNSKETSSVDIEVDINADVLLCRVIT